MSLRPQDRAIPLPEELVRAEGVCGPSRRLRPCDAATPFPVIRRHRRSFFFGSEPAATAWSDQASEPTLPPCKSLRAEFSAKRDRKIQMADRDIVQHANPAPVMCVLHARAGALFAKRRIESCDGIEAAARAIPLPGEFVQAARVGGPSRGLRPCDAAKTFPVIRSHGGPIIRSEPAGMACSDQASEPTLPQRRSLRAEIVANMTERSEWLTETWSSIQNSAGHVRSTCTGRSSICQEAH